LACRHNNGVYPVVPILYLDVLREEDEGDAWDMVAEDGNGKGKLDSESIVRICAASHTWPTVLHRPFISTNPFAIIWHSGMPYNFYNNKNELNGSWPRLVVPKAWKQTWLVFFLENAVLFGARCEMA
jgi:hypothetical protein